MLTTDKRSSLFCQIDEVKMFNNVDCRTTWRRRNPTEVPRSKRRTDSAPPCRWSHSSPGTRSYMAGSRRLSRLYQAGVNVIKPSSLSSLTLRQNKVECLSGEAFPVWSNTRGYGQEPTLTGKNRKG
jgi:hypothetical protein